MIDDTQAETGIQLANRAIAYVSRMARVAAEGIADSLDADLNGPDWLVVPHPVGNFTAVQGTLNRPPRPATPNDPAFYLLDEALEYAEAQPGRFASFHPSVLWVPYSRWGARWYRFKRWLQKH